MFSGAMVAGCGKSGQSDQQAAARPAEVVRIVAVQRASAPRHVRVTGTLFGQEETTVAAKVAGRMIEIVRDVGDQAAPGDLLARVDPTDFILERDERRLAARQALAELGLEALPQGDFDVQSLPTVQRASLQAENARLRFERGKQLQERDPPLISEQDFTDLRTAYEVAQADHRVAALTAEALLAEARVLAAQVRTAEQQVADTEHLVPHGSMRAGEQGQAQEPLHYVVARRLVSVGDLVQVGTPLFRLVDMDPVKLRAAVPERRAATIRVGQSARLATEAHPEPVAARVSRISPAVDSRTRTFEVEILAPNPTGALNPGAFAGAEIHIGVEDNVILVPSSAIVSFAGVDKVYIVQDGKAVDRPVRLGERFSNEVEVVQGLDGQEWVVLDPPATLTGGTSVEATAVEWTPRIGAADVLAEASP